MCVKTYFSSQNYVHYMSKGFLKILLHVKLCYHMYVGLDHEVHQEWPNYSLNNDCIWILHWGVDMTRGWLVFLDFNDLSWLLLWFICVLHQAALDFQVVWICCWAQLNDLFIQQLKFNWMACKERSKVTSRLIFFQ